MTRFYSYIIIIPQQSCESLDGVHQLINDDIVQLHVNSYNLVHKQVSVVISTIVVIVIN